jgi:hypothetical protein
VDFIFGGSAAYFDHCEIYVKANGYITAANTPKDQKYGYVFSHTKITGEPNALAYLGRPWRPYAATVFLDTEMWGAIRPVGWNNWNDPAKEKTARYGEYPQTDPARVAWARALTAPEAATYTIENVLGGIDGWDPKTRSVRWSVQVTSGPAKRAPISEAAKGARRYRFRTSPISGWNFPSSMGDRPRLALRSFQGPAALVRAEAHRRHGQGKSTRCKLAAHVLR